MELAGRRLSRDKLFKLTVAAGVGATVGTRFLLEPESADAKPTKKYSWAQDSNFVPPRIVCYRDPSDFQSAARFWQAEPSPFHDAVLVAATKRIQGILDGVASKAPKSSPTLSFIVIANQLFLVWAKTVARRPRGATIDAHTPLARVSGHMGLSEASRAPAARSRIWYADGSGNIFCPAAKPPNCYGIRLWRAAKPTPWHPRELMQATASVQAVLDDVASGAAGTARELSILTFDYRPLLVWAKPHAKGVTAADDQAKVVKALGLKTA